MKTHNKTEQINGITQVKNVNISTDNKDPKIKKGDTQNKTSKIVIPIAKAKEEVFLNRKITWKTSAQNAGATQMTAKFLGVANDSKHSIKINK